MPDKGKRQPSKKKPYVKPSIIAEEKMSIEFCKIEEDPEQRCPRS